MRLLSEVIHSLLSFGVIILGLAGLWGFLKLLHWLFPVTNSREFGLWLFLAGPTLLAIGGGIFGLLLVVYLVAKRSRARDRHSR